MNIRPKTKQRVLILAAVLVAFIIGGYGLVRIRRHLNNLAAFKAHEAGLAAYAQADWPTCIEKLSLANKRLAPDADSMWALAVAYIQLPATGQNARNNRYAAKDLLKDFYLPLRPGDLNGQHYLLELYVSSEMYNDDALNLANSILQKHPDDLPALRALTVVTDRLGTDHDEEALADAEKYLALDWSDLEIQRLALQLMHDLHRPPADILARGEKILHDHTDAHGPDPRAQLLAAQCHFMFAADSDAASDVRQGHLEQYGKLIMAAADADPPDASFVLQESAHLESRLRQFPVALRLLEKGMAKFKDLRIRDEVVSRQWQLERFQNVVDELSDLDPARTPQSYLLAYKAMSLHSLGKLDLSTALIDVLAKRENDSIALAWAKTLRALYDDKLDDRARVAQFHDAIKGDSYNPYLHYFLAEAYRRLGDSDLALEEWSIAATNAPSWMMPHLRIVTLEANAGASDTPEARSNELLLSFTGRDAAGQLKPDALVGLILAEYNRAERSAKPDRIKTLLTQIEKIPSTGADQNQVLPQYIQLLMQDGQRAKAEASIDAAVAQPAAIGQETLLRLADVSNAQSLGREDAIFAAIEKQFGLTPQLAYEKARFAMDFHQAVAADCLKQLQSDKARGVGSAVQWDRYICELRQRIGDPQAGKAWQELAANYPDDLAIQTLVLGKSSPWADHDGIAKILVRVSALAGEDSFTWKFNRARWLITGPDARKDAPDAAYLLNDLARHYATDVRPHLLLADAYLLMRDMNNCAAEWRQAAELAPGTPQVQFNLFGVLHQMGRSDEARTAFDKLAEMSNLPADMARRAADMIADQGDYPRAEQLLLKYPDNSSPHWAFDLAKVYRLEGKVDEAANTYFKLIKRNDLSADMLENSADFFASQHDMDQSHKLLNRIANLGLDPGMAKVLISVFDEHRNSFDAAAQDYEAAVAASPDDPSIATLRAAFYLRHGRYIDAADKAGKSLRLFPTDTALTAIANWAATLQELPNTNNLRLAVEIISYNPRDPAAAETLDLVISSASQPPSDALLDRYRALVEKHPQFLPAYVVDVDYLLLSGKVDEAIGRASLAADLFATTPQAAELATHVYQTTGQWQHVVSAAQQWRRRSLDQTLPADLAIAEAEMNLGSIADATKTLEPYLADAQARPDDNVELLRAYCRALTSAGNDAAAEQILRPLAEKSPAWRTVWLQVAVIGHSSADAAAEAIQKIVPLIDPNSLEQQSTLADAWYQLAVRFNNPPAYVKCRDLLKPFVADGQLDVPSLADLGSAADQSGDDILAAQAYRDALGKHSNNVAIKNNLAFILLREGDTASLNEAANLARQACAATSDPHYWSYLDTLARIYRSQGRFDQSAQTYQLAIAIRSDDPMLLAGQALAWAQAGQLDKATLSLTQADTLIQSGKKPSDETQRWLDQTRQLLKKAAPGSAGSVP